MRDAFDILLRTLRDDLTVRDADKLWQTVLTRAGHEFKKGCKFLGAGSYGCALRLDNGKVLKITLDPSEARTMQKVQQDPSDLVVRIDDIFQVSPAKTKGSVYCIVQEKLEEPDLMWQDAVRYVGAVLKRRNEFLTPDTLRMYFYPREIRRNTEDERHALLDRPEIKAWLTELADYFDRGGIRFEDFHGNNIMQLNGQHKMIDLGRSKRRTDRLPMTIVGAKRLRRVDLGLVTSRVATRYGRPFQIVG